MIGNRMCAFALSLAVAIICSALPAAAQFDGNWSMVAVTTSGVGRVSASGQVRMNAVAGPRMAYGTGRFKAFGAAERGQGPVHQASAQGFGAPVAVDYESLQQYDQPLVEIDFGARV